MKVGDEDSGKSNSEFPLPHTHYDFFVFVFIFCSQDDVELATLTGMGDLSDGSFYPGRETPSMCNFPRGQPSIQ